MKTFLLSLTTIIIFLLSLSSVVLADEIKVGAGQAPTENILKPIKEHFEKATGIKLTITPTGPKMALMELEIGTVEVALGGLSFDDWMNFIKEEKVKVKDPSIFQHVVVGRDRIKVLVHKDNPVSKLTKEQLKGIFTGKVINWKDVGGNDIPIAVVWTRLFGGNYLFTKTILGGEPLKKNVFQAITSKDERLKVASNPEAVAIGPLAIVDSTIKSPKTPEIVRPITLITKGKPSPNVQKLIDFIKREGKKYVKQ